MKAKILFDSFIVGLCFLIIFVAQVDASGHMQIRLNSYENVHGSDKDGNCCDGLAQGQTNVCKPCDHYIVACLLDARDHGQGSCVSNNVSTEPVNDTNFIPFGPIIGKELNPFSLNFAIPSNNLELAFSVYDEDKYDAPASEANELYNNNYVVYTLMPQSFTVNASFTNGTILFTNKSRLLFDYALQCDDNFYHFCERYCVPDPVRYACDSSGLRVCKQGWQGKNCTTYNFCWNETCSSSGTCHSGVTDYSCVCVLNRTGRRCESIISANNRTVPTVLSNLATTTKRNLPLSNKDQDNKSKSKAPMIAGVTIGVVAGLTSLAGGIAYLVKRQKNKIHDEIETANENGTQEECKEASEAIKSDQNGTTNNVENETVQQTDIETGKDGVTKA